MTFTQEDKRDKIRSQLLFELTNPEPPKIRTDKSNGGLQPKRLKFLQNPKNRKQPNEKRYW